MLSLLNTFFVVCNIAHVSSWYHSIKSLPVPISSQQVGFKHPNIYLFGGDSNPAPTGTLKWNISDITKNNWTTMNDEPPSFISNTQNSVIIADIVYFIGVENSANIYGITYLFNMSNQEWIKNDGIPNMTYPVINGCVSSNNTHIFIMGGIYNNRSLDKHCYLQIYDMNTNKWMAENISFINKTRWSNQMCSMVNNTLYTFGGLYDDKNIANIVSKYNTITHEWTFIMNMSHPLHNGWSVYYNKNKTIYIIGGSNNDNDISSGIQHEIKIFDTKTESFIGSNAMLDNVENAAALIVFNTNKSDEMMVFGGCAPNNNDKTCKLLSSVQISELPLKVTTSSDSAKTVWWRVIVFIAVIVVFVVVCCWLEMGVGNKNKVINQDPLIIQNDMNIYTNASNTSLP